MTTDVDMYITCYWFENIPTLNNLTISTTENVSIVMYCNKIVYRKRKIHNLLKKLNLINKPWLIGSIFIQITETKNIR